MNLSDFCSKNGHNLSVFHTDTVQILCVRCGKTLEEVRQELQPEKK